MMSTETIQPLSLLHFDFSDLYARHLGRHSQFGINIAHLGALYGMWFGIYSALKQAVLLLDASLAGPIIVAVTVAYLATLAMNAPLRVILATTVFLACFAASVLALPKLPGGSILAFIGMVPVFYKLQAWSHKIWNVAADMTEFNRRMPPGRTLTLILLLYEVPICLNYLVFCRKDWRR
jgi:hypothetical protein